eukprot:3941980-Rhodomonas_salina.2
MGPHAGYYGTLLATFPAFGTLLGTCAPPRYSPGGTDRGWVQICPAPVHIWGYKSGRTHLGTS